MKRVLIINLTRMGDIIQTTPLISGLQSRWPDVRISLLVMEGFRFIGEMVPGVEHLFTWDQDETVHGILGEQPLDQQYTQIRRLVDPLRSVHFDLIINVSHSRESAVLMSMLRADRVAGLLLDRKGRKKIEHPWVNYFFNVTANRGFNNFNLVDVYRMIGDVPAGSGQLSLHVPIDADDWAEQLLQTLNPAHRQVIAVQPGANRNNRRWPQDYFARMMELVAADTPTLFLLLGTKAERSISEEISSQCRVAVTNLAGETTVPQLAALLARVDLLISNDTGTMHVAAAMNTPTVALFMATALPYETGAWTEHTLILQPDMECAPCSHHVVCPHVRCRFQIKPEDVAQAVAFRLHDRQVSWGEHLKVYESVWNHDHMVQLLPLHHEPLSAVTLLLAAYRVAWKQLLSPSGSTVSLTQLHSQALADIDEQRRYLQQRIQDPHEWLQLDLDYEHRIIDEVAAYGQRGLQAATALLNEIKGRADRDTLRTLIEEIADVDAVMYEVEMQHEFIRPLCVMYRFAKENMDDDDPKAMASESIRLYQDLYRRASFLQTVLNEMQRLPDQFLPLTEPEAVHE